MAPRALAAARFPTGLILAAALLAGCGGEAGDGQVGAMAPDVTARSLEGQTVALADFHGEVVLLNVWATWCAPCRAEMPAFEQIHREQERAGLRIVGVSIDAPDATGEMRRFLAEHSVTFRILHDPDQEMTSRLGTLGVPETFLIGRDGRILHRWTGRIDPHSPTVRARIDAALRG